MNYANDLLLSGTTIEGTKVLNFNDKKLGSIKDIMIDIESGRIAYAVLSVHDGFLNLDSKYFAIPWQALEFDTKNELVRLDITEERLESSPGFDKDNWPTAPQNEFINDVYTYYGYESFYTDRGNFGDRTGLGNDFESESMIGTEPSRPVSDFDEDLDYDNNRRGL
ncbi:MAG: PRC-barrel domain-containing protein [Cyclobacteriaceae bacterium]